MEKQNKDSELLLDSAIAEKLKLSYEERIEAHEKALELLRTLEKAGEDLRAGSE